MECRIAYTRSHIDHWDMVGGWCVTRVIQSCMSNHMCTVIVHMFSHCSVIVLCVTLPGMYCPFINFMFWSPQRFHAKHGYWHPRIRDR